MRQRRLVSLRSLASENQQSARGRILNQTAMLFGLFWILIRFFGGPLSAKELAGSMAGVGAGILIVLFYGFLFERPRDRAQRFRIDVGILFGYGLVVVMIARLFFAFLVT